MNLPIYWCYLSYWRLYLTFSSWIETNPKYLDLPIYHSVCILHSNTLSLTYIPEKYVYTGYLFLWYERLPTLFLIECGRCLFSVCSDNFVLGQEQWTLNQNNIVSYLAQISVLLGPVFFIILSFSLQESLILQTSVKGTTIVQKHKKFKDHNIYKCKNKCCDRLQDSLWNKSSIWLY